MFLQNQLLKRIHALCTPHNSAKAHIRGISDYRQVEGIVTFKQLTRSVLVTAYIQGLPYKNSPCQNEVFGFHIHEGTSCSGTPSNPLANALGHYNPHNCLHPHHAGDMPPLFGNKGDAFLSFETNRLRVSDVVGRVIIIHRNPDDFTTQPSGNAGEMIACGKINR